MHLGRPSSSRAPQSLVHALPVAACWWARIKMLSIIKTVCPLVGSANTRSQAPRPTNA